MTPAAQLVLEDVARETNVSVTEMLGKSRIGPTVKARKEAMRRLYVDKKRRTPEIARLFGMQPCNVRFHLRSVGIELGGPG